MVTLQQIIQATPAAKLRAASYVPALNAAMDKFGINTPLRQAAFLAQIFHESGNLTCLEENLNYRAETLVKVWPKRFPTIEVARQYEHNPTKLANKVYANRMGNGDEASGDGFLYRGAGAIQLTGKTNQFACALALDIDVLKIGEYLRTIEGACMSAAWFWNEINGNSYADNGTAESFVELSKRINGGTVGLHEREQLYKEFRRVLGVQ